MFISSASACIWSAAFLLCQCPQLLRLLRGISFNRGRSVLSGLNTVVSVELILYGVNLVALPSAPRPVRSFEFEHSYHPGKTLPRIGSANDAAVGVEYPPAFGNLALSPMLRRSVDPPQSAQGMGTVQARPVEGACSIPERPTFPLRWPALHGGTVARWRSCRQWARRGSRPIQRLVETASNRSSACE